MSDKLLMFGRSYNLYGDSNADVIIKTKGQVKILWGSKFIDLIKDGKIAVDSSFIFKVQDVSKIGVKDGIYVVGGESVYLKVGDSTINLIGEMGDTFVSFMKGQETTSDAKYNAMVNIGFIYKSLDEVSSTSLQNGVIYIESELKLYLVKDGVLSEFKVTIPNPFTEQFVILKSDSSKGALVIKGTGSANSVAFDSFLIYTEFDNCIIDTTNAVVVKVGGSDKITVDSSSVTINADLITNMIKYPSSTADSGFRLYYMNGESVLEVDRIIERSSQYGSDEESSIVIYPEYWLLNNRIIKDATLHDDTPEDEELEGTSNPTNILDLTLFLKCTYKVGDILCTYKQEDIEEDTGLVDEEGLPITNTISSYAKVELEVTSVGVDGKEIQVKCSDTLDNDTVNNFIGKFIFLIKSSDNKLPIRLKSNSIDIVEYGDKSGDTRNESIKTRVGNLTELNLIETKKETNIPIEGHGIYSKQSYFEKAGYIKGYNLPEDDDSSKLASTEWVNKKLSSFSVDINLTIDTETVNPQEYFSRLDILDLFNKQEVGTIVSYLGLFGVLTIVKTDRDLVFNAIVRAKNDSGLWSHRSISSTYDSVTNSWYNSSTYIILDLFNPGYYWSKGFNNGKPNSPEYIGTTDLGFLVTEEKPYLLYTNDGKTWNIVAKYIPPVSDKIYIISTGKSSNINTSTDKVVLWPSGFLGYAKNKTTITTKLGKSNYIPIESLINGTPSLLKIKELTTEAEPGLIPQKIGYFYLWSILKDLDKTIPSNWVSESSGTLPVTLKYNEVSDWGNSSLKPGYEIWEVNSENTIIGKPSSDKFIGEIGTESNWQNPVWRKSFLETIIGDTLTINEHNYDPTFGWRFHWSGILKSVGYAGYWTSRIAGLQDPTSDDENDIGYIPTALLGNLYGEVMDRGELILFLFMNVRIGKLLPYRYSLGGYSIGDKLQQESTHLYEASYDSCYYRRTKDYLLLN